MTKPSTSTAELIRYQIQSQGERYWRYCDFSSLSPTAVSKTLSRLSQEGFLRRVSKGLYYHPRQTRFGASRPSQSELQQVALKHKLHPAGVSAANLLGFTTQNAVQGEFATSATSVPSKLLHPRSKLYTRRPSTWDSLSATEASLLDFLRNRGRWSDLFPEQTKERLLEFFRSEECFAKLVKVAPFEPSRVQAMLGAIGQELNHNQELLTKLRQGLNPLSRFDFGILGSLDYAQEWQGK